jgi:hypothetical protein
MEKGSHHEGLSCRVENPVHLLLCLSCSPTTTSRLHLDHRPFPTSVANSNTRCWVTVACGGVYASLRGHSFHLCATSAPAAILLTQHYSIYHTTSCDTTVIARSAHPPSVSKPDRHHVTRRIQQVQATSLPPLVPASNSWLTTARMREPALCSFQGAATSYYLLLSLGNTAPTMLLASAYDFFPLRHGSEGRPKPLGRLAICPGLDRPVLPDHHVSSPSRVLDRGLMRGIYSSVCLGMADLSDHALPRPALSTWLVA